MGESRQELLAWMNNLLQLNVTKVEQCGTGAALCQIYDSVFQDIPMSRVKFNVNTEYAYIQNFKILQNAFTRHSIERQVPIESLVKCKMQDNLEFLQWSKKYWDQYYPGGEYDAISRRKGAGAPTATATRTSGGTGAARRGTTPTVASTRPSGVKAGGAASSALASENTQLKQTVEGLERERDFYFQKLRDIELLLQNAFENDPKLEEDDSGFFKQVQQVLYSTEEGFEIPADAEGAVDDGETF